MESSSLIMIKLFLKSVAACSGGPTREVKYDTTEGLDVAAHDAGIDQTGKDHAGKDQTGADIVGMPDDGYSFDGKEDGIAHADDGYVPETPAAEILGDVADADIGLDGVCTTDAACGDAQDANADTDADTPLSLPEVILPPPTDTSHDAKPAPDVIKIQTNRYQMHIQMELLTAAMMP
ncbi:MAG: hypothetical protein HYU98_02530 [Deltaproteobacteria bacterium]|nr:hypothetical protein [Deltaproteobacteria bacterium]